jgi:C1A family cysteine protease
MFTDAIRDNASQNKAVWGYYVSTADRNLIKMKVAQNKPAMFTCQLDRQLTYWIPSNTIWTFPHYRDGGPHGMIIVGYDDNKNAYLALNSWSSDWGNSGRVWIDYDFFEQNVTGACWYFGE